jgi:hypothetical protein
MAWAIWIVLGIWVIDSRAVLVTWRLPSGATIDLAESRDESAVEAATARFNATAGRRRGPLPTTPP